MKRVIFLFVFLLVLFNVTAKLSSVDQQHTSESYDKGVTLFEKLSSLSMPIAENIYKSFNSMVASFRKLSSLESSLIQNNNTNTKQKVAVFRKLDRISFTNQMHNSTSNGFSVNVTKEFCKGTIQLQSIDLDLNLVPFTKVFFNNTFNGTTDIFGLFESKQRSVCGEALHYTLKCQNNITCETKTTALDFHRDFDSLSFDCSVCTGNSDLKVTLGNVNISKETNKINVNITIVNVAANNINLTVKAQDKDTELITNENSIIFNVNAGDRFSSQTVSLNLDNADFVHVYIDPDGKVTETYEDNNYAAVPVITNKRKVFINVSTGNPYVDEAIKDYLSLFVIPTSNDDSSLTIAVGLGEHNSLINSKSSYTKDNFKWYVDGNSVYYNNNPIDSRPWVGLVGAFRENTGGDDYVFAMGKEIEGVVAATKRLVNARDKFFVPQLLNSHTSIIEDTDTLGISVFDLMHNEENKDKFINQRNSKFQKVVESILEDNNFEIAIKTVRTVNDNTTLRVKNLKSDFSADFRDAIVNDTRPIVFSGGLWNNLFYWENNKLLLTKLTGKGRDLWEIEITGGPEQDGKQNSPNYNYNATRDYYWPALVAGVQKYSGKNSLQYVGHSNGCGVALASLNSYSASGKEDAGYYFDTSTGQYVLTDLSANPVDTFVGMGCPGALDGYSPFYKYFGMFGDKIVKQIKSEHVTAREVSQRLLALCDSELEGDEEQYCVLAAKGLDKVDGDFKVSKNLLIDYLNDVKDANNGPQVSLGLSINRLRLYSNQDFSKRYRAKVILGLGGRFDTSQLKHDIVVSQQDSQEMSDRIVTTNSVKLVNYTDFHHGRNDFKDFMDDLEVFLND